LNIGWPRRPTRTSRTGQSAICQKHFVLFYSLPTIIVLTGLVLTWADEVTWLHSMEHTAKEIHNVTMYIIIAFFVVHVVGVVWAELTKDHGLISRMVGGVSRLGRGEV
jgi:thiosulfate reductase cytochrome b subunit